MFRLEDLYKYDKCTYKCQNCHQRFQIPFNDTLDDWFIINCPHCNAYGTIYNDEVTKILLIRARNSINTLNEVLNSSLNKN